MSGQQIANAKYRNWVKAGLGLKYLKEGLEPLCDDIVKQHHVYILNNVKQKHNLTTVNCGRCRLRTLHPDHVRIRYKQCPLGQKDCNCQYPGGKFLCPNNICGATYDEIIKHHASTPPAPYWRNTDVQLWCTEPWAVATCFINAPGYVQKLNASEIDCSGLLHLLINNKHLQTHINCKITGKDVFSMVRQHRNTIFHCENMELEDTEVDTYIDDMIAALQDSKELNHRNESKAAVKKLLQLKQHDFIITTSLEAEVKAARTSFKDLQDELERKLKAEIEQKGADAKAVLVQKGSDIKSEMEQKGSYIKAELEQKRLDIIEEVEHKVLNIKADVEKKGSDIKVKMEQNVLNIKADMEQKGSDIKAEIKQKVSNINAAVDQKGSDITAQLEQKGSDIRVQMEQKGSDIRAQMEQKESDIRAQIEQKGSDIGAQMEQKGSDIRVEIEQKGSDMKTEIKQICSDIKTDLEKKGTQMEQKGSDISAQMEQKESDIRAQIERKGSDIGAQIEQKGSYIKAQLEQKGTNIRAQMEQKGSDIRAQMEQKESDIRAKIEQKGSDIGAQIEQKESNISAQMEQKESDIRAQMEQKGSDIKEQLEQKGSNIRAQMDQKGSDIKAQLEQKGSDIRAQMEQKVSDIGARMEQKGSDIRVDVEQKGSDMKTEIKQIGSDIKTDLEKKGKDLKIELQESFSQCAESARERKYSEMKKEYQKKLMQDYKQYAMQVSALPLQPESNQTGIENVYVSPWITVDKWDKTSRQTKEVKISVDEIFHNEDKPARNIYALGEAGSGKTTFCKMLVYYWCVAHTEREANASESSAVKVMENYDFLFYLSLRHNSDLDKIEIMLDEIYPDPVLRLILQNESDKCLILLDGLDEWTPQYQRTSQFLTPGLPTRDLHAKYTIIITTRRWKFDTLRIKDSEIDKKIKLTGIRGTAVEELTKTTVKTLNETFHKNKDADDFLPALKKSPVADVSHVPMILQQLICVWFDDRLRGNSKCAIYSSMLDLFFDWNALKLLKNQKVLLHMEREFLSRLPEYLNEYQACLDNTNAIYHLSHLSYKTLFGRHRENTLTFSNSNIQQLNIPDDVITLSLKVGILSEDQNKNLFASRRQHTSFSFVHKTLQEFLAAVYVAIQFEKMIQSLDDKQKGRYVSLEYCKQFVRDHFRDCKTVADILEQSNILIMLCGVESQLLPFISEYIYILLQRQTNKLPRKVKSQTMIYLGINIW